MIIGVLTGLMARLWIERLIFVVFMGLMPAFGWAQLNSHFLVQNESFLSPQFEATDQNQYQFLGLRLRNDLDTESLFLDSEAVMALGAPVLSYIKVKEAAFQFQNSKTQALILGRKKKTWSGLDERWSLGVVEPTFKWNPLNRESLGLTGLFWSVEEKYFHFTAFWSPLYVPDQGPNFEIDGNGQFKKVNPWFQTPPRTFRPFPAATEDSTINYNVQRPSESEIVFQSTLGGSIEGLVDDNFLWRASHFYKPMNQLALGYGGVYVLSEREGNVDIIPQVGYHRVTSADMILKTGLVDYGVMAILDRPGQVSFDSEWTAPKFEDAYLYGTFVQINLNRQILSLEYMTIDGGRVQEVGDLSDSDRAPITSRYPFHEAIKLKYQVRRALGVRERVTAELSWTHSDRNQFDLVQLRGQFEFSKRWQTYTDMQLVRAKSLNSKNHNDIATHENNDRLMVGVAYEL